MLSVQYKLHCLGNASVEVSFCVPSIKAEAFSSGQTKIVDFAYFYLFGQFLLISAAHGPNPLISSAHGCGRPWVAKNVDFIIFLHQISKN